MRRRAFIGIVSGAVLWPLTEMCGLITSAAPRIWANAASGRATRADYFHLAREPVNVAAVSMSWT